MQTLHFAKYEALLDESSRDPKLAMRDCERRLKKSPQDPAINLFRVNLLVKLRNYEPAHQHCVLLAQNPRVAEDGDIVTELLRLEHLTSQALARDGSSDVIKALEKYKDCVQSAFGALVAYGYWEAAESAAIALQKIRPKDKQRQLVRFLMSKLYASSCRKSNPTTSTMRDRLLKAMLKKAIETSALSTTQDLRFFLQLHVELQDWTAALEFLDNEKLGLFSPLGKADIEFIRVKLDCLTKLGRWQDVLDFCVLVISAGADGQDPVAELRQWKLDAFVWQHMTDALAVLKKDDASFDFQKFTTDLVHDVDLDSSSSRIIWVSRMRFASKSPPQTQDTMSGALAKVCSAYLEEHYARPYCCEDLQSFIQAASPAQSEQLLQDAGQLMQRLEAIDNHWAVAELNRLKLRFVASLSSQRSSSPATAQDFVLEVLHLISQLTSFNDSDASVLENAFLLAVSGIEKTMELTNSAAERSLLLLQAVALLEHALQDSNAPTSYRARLLLITFYRRLCCISLAMQHYKALRIREIQNETVSHLLHHRISSLHAFALEHVEQKRHKLDLQAANPTFGLQGIINWYDVATDRVNGFISGRVDDTRYDKVQEFLSLKDRLLRSQWRQLATLERRRIARLADRVYDETDQKIDFLNEVWATELSDNRDFNCSTASRSLSRDVADAQAALYYTAVMTEIDAVHSLLTVKDPLSEHHSSLIRLSHCSEILQRPAPSLDPFLPLERVAHKVIRSLRPLAVATVLGDKPELAKSIPTLKDKDIDAILSDITDFVSSVEPLHSDQDTKQWQQPDDATLITVVSQLECLKIISKLVDLLSSASKQRSHVLFKKVKAEVLVRIKDDALTSGGILQNSVQDFRQHIRAEWRSLLNPLAAEQAEEGARSGVAAEVVKTVGKEWLIGTLAPMLRDSMMETLDGISRIQIG